MFLQYVKMLIRIALEHVTELMCQSACKYRQMLEQYIVNWEPEGHYQELQVKDVPLRTRRALSLYKVYGDSALPVLSGTNSSNALLVLSGRCFLWGKDYIYMYLLYLWTDRLFAHVDPKVCSWKRCVLCDIWNDKTIIFERLVEICMS